MDDLFLIVIVALAAIVTIGLFPWLVIAMVHLLHFLWDVTGGSIFSSYRAAGARFYAWQYDRDLRAQAAGASRSSSFRSSAWASDAPDRETLEFGALLQKVVGNCNAIHHYAAEVLAVEDMSELENHAICAGFRDRVIAIEDSILDRLQRSGTNNLTLAKMAIGVDRMRDICSECMLLRFRRSNLPQLCDPAAHMGCGPDEHTSRAA